MIALLIHRDYTALRPIMYTYTQRAKQAEFVLPIDDYYYTTNTKAIKLKCIFYFGDPFTYQG